MEKINIQLKENQKIFFTSDHHFGHKGVLNFIARPFSDMKDMRRGLIERWNQVVGIDDIVFDLGDFYWHQSSTELKGILDMLNGSEIYHIPGNHDNKQAWRNTKVCDDTVLLWVTKFGETKPYTFVLHHYPLMTWSGRDRGVSNLHGHTHSGPNSRSSEFDMDLPFHHNQYDVGVDNNDYYPIEMEQVISKIRK